MSFEDLSGRRPPPAGKTYAVSELVRLASRKLEATFGDVWVEGEVSNLRTPASGHAYFTLKDDRAQLSVVMFRSAVRRLEFKLEDGLLLRCRGRLCIYDAQGRFQLTAEAAEPSGVGALQLAFEQLKRKLEAEGLFDPRHKKPLPALPRVVMVVTSRTGAAVRDIIRVLHRRFPVRVVLCPTLVQGAEAPLAIVRALEQADSFGGDLIIVGRGGGSLEDLWAFNDERVARAIFAARTPVISAVGHEVDVTISDLVADKRAPTPSAAAELAVPVLADVREHVEQQRHRILRAAQRAVSERSLAIERLRRRMGTPYEIINRSRMAVDDATARLEGATRRRLARGRDRLFQLRARLGAQEPRVRLARDRAALLALEHRLVEGIRRVLADGQDGIRHALTKLEAISPTEVLERGYVLVRDADGAVVRDVAALRCGDRLLLRFARGLVRCIVDQVEPGDGRPGDGGA